VTAKSTDGFAPVHNEIFMAISPSPSRATGRSDRENPRIINHITRAARASNVFVLQAIPI